MSQSIITSRDISLVKQNHQVRYIKLQIINCQWQSIGVIDGSLISCNISIDGTTSIQRTANISMKTESDHIIIDGKSNNASYMKIDFRCDLPSNYYIRLWAGIQDNNTLQAHWYSQGFFIIAQSSYSFDPATKILNMTLVDLMSDLNGDRGGELHAFTSIVKNQQRIDEVMKDVMKIVGIKNYAIAPISVLRLANTVSAISSKEEDFMVPYDINFSAGVTAYEILDKLVNLYPYYRMGFDVNGKFIVERQLLENDIGYIILKAEDIYDIILSEDTTIDWNYIRNHIEVWGKDGKYYGEADDKNPRSPFQISRIKLRRLVVKDNEYGIDTNTICDRYRDDDLEIKLQKEQATIEARIAELQAITKPTEKEKQELASAKFKLTENLTKQNANIAISGNELAQEWAERILYDRTRLQDNITIKTVFMPFINDVNFKLSYRSKVEDVVRTYVVKSVNHDISGGTTTINMIRFYNDSCVNYWSSLGKPVITSAQGIGMDIVVSVEPVLQAEQYELFVDGNKVATYTGTTMIYTMPDYATGRHSVAVAAIAPFHLSSDLSDRVYVTTEPLPNDILITNTSDYLVTNDGYKLKYNEG